MLSRHWHRLSHRVPRRRLLTDAYAQPAWWHERHDHVLKTLGPTQQSFDPYEYLTNLRKRCIGGERVSALQVDLGVHCVEESQQINDVVDLIYTHRHGPQAVYTLDSTHDCIIRTLVHYEQFDTVSTLLYDTLNYGVFPSNHMLNVVISECLKRDDLTNAAKVAGYAMLQEVVSDSRLTGYLALIACTRWVGERIASPSTDVGSDANEEKSADAVANADYWNQLGRKIGTNPEIESEEEYVMAVPYLKNASFDYHFDLSQPEHIVGKTLMWTAQYCQPQHSDPVINKSCALLGAVLFEQPDVAHSLLADDTTPITCDVRDACVTYINQSLLTRQPHVDTIDDDQLQVVGKFDHPPNAVWQRIIDEMVVTVDDDGLVDRLTRSLAEVRDELEAVDSVAYEQRMAEEQQRREAMHAAEQSNAHAARLLDELREEKIVLLEKQRVLSFFDNRVELERQATMDTSQLCQEEIVEKEELTETEYASRLSTVYTQRTATGSTLSNPTLMKQDPLDYIKERDSKLALRESRQRKSKDPFLR